VSGTSNQPLRFVNFLSPALEPTYARIAEFVGARLSRPTLFRNGCSFEELDNGQADVAFICGLAYLRVRKSAPLRVIAAPVLQGERYAGRAVYFSDVVVRRESPYTSFADLRGTRFAYNEEGSHSGYNVVAYSLRQRGERLPFFARLIRTGSHIQSLRAVAAGVADTAAIDSHVWDLMCHENADLVSTLRPIHRLGPSTSPPVVIHARNAADAERMRSALVSMHQDSDGSRWLARGSIAQFLPANDYAYSDVARMLAVARTVSVSELATSPL
jgi:phosphonate transport system substrate-binding protein